MSPFQGRFAAGCLFPLAILLGFPATAGEAQWPDLSAPPSSTGGGEDDAAVIVGIEGYTYVDPVPGAIGNAQDWYAWLTGTRRVPVGRIALLRDMDGTREEILAAAGRAAEQVGRGGTVWFVFVGHGAPSRDGHDGLLLGVDTMQKADSIYARGVVQQELLDAMTAGTQARTVVVLDACFSGKSSSGTALVEGLQPLVPTYAQQTGSATVFSAGRADQFAGPLPGTRRPAFSYLLLGALRGWGDADGDGTVTAQEALDYTTSALYALVRDRAQTPELRGPGGPEVLARAEEDGPDLAAMVLSMEPGRGALPATGESTVSTGSDVDLAAAAAEAQRLRREREALEERERELQRQLAEERQRRRDEATADLLDSARVEWLALAPLIDSPSSEAAGVVELYVEKYGDAGVTVDGEKTTVTVSQVDEAREWLQRHARTLRDGSFGGEVIDRLGYEMISIASGDFWMGSPSTDTGWSEDEIEHHVRITAPYLIGATEVTQDLWKAVMEDSPAANRQSYFSGGTRGACNEMDGVSLVGGDLPVHCVDWLDVVRFCNRLSEAEGLEPAYQISGETVTWDRMTAGYRLPTEAEWEFAARAGSSDRYAGTDNDDRVCEIGNVTGVETSSRWPGWQAFSCSDGVAGLASTASFRANRWGLYDMTGNVYEWVWDWYGEYPGGTTTDPVGPPTGPGRIIRGGSWDRGPEDVRVANRSYNLPNGRRTNNGFRVARSIP